MYTVAMQHNNFGNLNSTSTQRSYILEIFDNAAILRVRKRLVVCMVLCALLSLGFVALGIVGFLVLNFTVALTLGLGVLFGVAAVVYIVVIIISVSAVTIFTADGIERKFFGMSRFFIAWSAVEKAELSFVGIKTKSSNVHADAKNNSAYDIITFFAGKKKIKMMLEVTHSQVFVEFVELFYPLTETLQEQLVIKQKVAEGFKRSRRVVGYYVAAIVFLVLLLIPLMRFINEEHDSPRATLNNTIEFLSVVTHVEQTPRRLQVEYFPLELTVRRADFGWGEIEVDWESIAVGDSIVFSVKTSDLEEEEEDGWVFVTSLEVNGVVLVAFADYNHARDVRVALVMAISGTMILILFVLIVSLLVAAQHAIGKEIALFKESLATESSEENLTTECKEEENLY